MNSIKRLMLVAIFLSATVSFAKTLGEEVHEITAELDRIDNVKSAFWGQNRDWTELQIKAKRLNQRLTEIETEIKNAAPSLRFGEEVLLVERHHQVNGSMTRSHNLYTYATIFGEHDGAYLLALFGRPDRLRVTTNMHTIRLQESEIDHEDPLVKNRIYLAKSQLGDSKFWVQPRHIRPIDYNSGVHDADKMVVYRDESGSPEVAFLNSRADVFSQLQLKSEERVVVSRGDRWVLGKISSKYKSYDENRWAYVIELADGTRTIKVVDSRLNSPSSFADQLMAKDSKEVLKVTDSTLEFQRIYWPKYTTSNKRSSFLGSKFLGAIKEGLFGLARDSTFESDMAILKVETTSSPSPVSYFVTEGGLVISEAMARTELTFGQKTATATTNFCESVLAGVKGLIP